MDVRTIPNTRTRFGYVDRVDISATRSTCFWRHVVPGGQSEIARSLFVCITFVPGISSPLGASQHPIPSPWQPFQKGNGRWWRCCLFRPGIDVLLAAVCSRWYVQAVGEVSEISVQTDISDTSPNDRGLIIC